MGRCYFALWFDVFKVSRNRLRLLRAFLRLTCENALETNGLFVLKKAKSRSIKIYDYRYVYIYIYLSRNSYNMSNKHTSFKVNSCVYYGRINVLFDSSKASFRSGKVRNVNKLFVYILNYYIYKV